MAREYKYNHTNRELFSVPVIFVSIICVLLLISLDSISNTSRNTLSLVLISLLSMALGVFTHESIHFIGYKLAGTNPSIRFNNMNPYITNLHSHINLKNKLLIDAAPSVIGGILFIILAIALSIDNETDIVTSFGLAIFNASILATSTFDWKIIYDMNTQFEDCEDFEIIHKIVKDRKYPTAIITSVTNNE